MIQFQNALVGKQFKHLLQLSVFDLSTSTSKQTFDLWNELGFLAALKWLPSTNNMDKCSVSFPSL
jgi:hypothetical protein